MELNEIYKKGLLHCVLVYGLSKHKGYILCPSNVSTVIISLKTRKNRPQG